MKRRGWSLLEVVIASGLALILGGSLLRLMIAGSRLYARSQARSEVLSVGMTTLSSLGRELREAAEATVTVVPGALSFRGPAIPGEAELSFYQPHPSFTVYAWDSEQKTLSRFSVPSPGAEYRLPQGAHSGLKNGRLVAAGVEQFRAESGARVVKLALRIRKELFQNHFVEESITETVFLRNRV